MLFWLALFQLTAAWWYWNGPQLPRTRGWVVTLFALNGAATLLAGLAGLLSWSFGGVLADAVDIMTNVPLLGVATSLHPGLRSRGLRSFCVAALGVPAAIAAVAALAGQNALGFSQDVLALLRELPLLASFVLVGAALGWGGFQRPRLIVASVLGMRFAELSASVFSIRFFDLRFVGPPGLVLGDVMRLAGSSALVVGAAALLFARRNSTAHDRPGIDLALGLVVGGFLIGTARAQAPSSASILYFTIAFIRPLAFLAAQSEMAGLDIGEDPRWRHVRSLGWAFAAGSIGLSIGAALWSLSTSAASLFAASVSLVWLVGERAVLSRTQHQHRNRNTVRVALTRAPIEGELARMPYWERLAVVLYAWRDLPPDAFERTTTALSSVTGVPYASLGTEMSRTNARVGASPNARHGAVVFAHTLGVATGPARRRVKIYRLTTEGERQAEGILERAKIARSDLEAMKPAWQAKVLEIMSNATENANLGTSKRSDSESD